MTLKHQAMVAPTAAGGLKGWHVAAMLSVFFGIVFTVNGVFLTSALRTHSGVVSVEPYVKGLKYNERIEAGDRQAKLGWDDTLTLGTDGRVAVTLRDAGGRPVQGLRFEGSLGRPATNRLDRPLLLAEAEPGRYVASGPPLEEGTWIVSLEAVSRDHAAEPVYRLRRRIWLKP